MYVSQFTSKRPIGKNISLDHDNGLVKTTPPPFGRGRYERKEVPDAGTLADYLAGLKLTQAIALGVAHGGIEHSRVKTKGKKGPGITRTRDCFEWADGPGWMLIDCDYPVEDLLEKLYQVVPALPLSDHVWMPSSSSNIFDMDSGVQLSGLEGQHVYVLVDCAEDIPAIGRAIHQRLWLAGHGHIQISKSGLQLERSYVDLAVHKPEHLVFAAGPDLDSTLERRCVDPVPYPGILRLSIRDVELSEDELQEYQAAVTKAKAETKPQADQVRSEWIEPRAKDYAVRSGVSIETARSNLQQFVDRERPLCGGFMLYPHGKQPITVGEVLANLDEWDGKNFADPFEPDYRGDTRIARLNRNGDSVSLYSFAHGGYRVALDPPQTAVPDDLKDLIEAMDRVHPNATVRRSCIVETMMRSLYGSKECLSIDDTGFIRRLPLTKFMKHVLDDYLLDWTGQFDINDIAGAEREVANLFEGHLLLQRQVSTIDVQVDRVVPRYHGHFRKAR